MNFQHIVSSYHPQLLIHPELIVQIEQVKGRELLSVFIELACQCSNIRNIQLGRAGIWGLPKNWVLENIEDLAEPMLQKHDEYEYRRLVEVYWYIDKPLTRKFATRCLAHSDSEIQAIGKECIEKLNDLRSSQTIHYWE